MSDLELAAADWLDALGREYFGTFVRDGGAAVKVAVVPTPYESSALAHRLMTRAREFGFLAAQVDAAVCKVHLVHNFFCEVAKQIDWDHVVREFVRSALRGEGFELPADGSLDVESLARANDQDVAIVKQAVRSMLTTRLMRDYSLGKQFRLGALTLCQALLEPDDVRRELAQHAQAWLRGELPRVGALRQAFIYQKIDRHTARTMVLSTSAFIRKAGWQGLLVVTDVSRYALAKALDDDFNRYSKSAALDMWETLRQFVDGTDDMDGCLLVFVAGREFLEDDQRGMRAYNALHLRLTDDVRDRRRPNPLAPMVRLAAVAGC